MSYGRLRLLLLAVCLSFPLALYLYTLAPVVTFVDSGELAAAVATRGVSHPSGSPFYILMASVAAAIPVGSVIVRLNAFSAICGAASAALLFLVFTHGRVTYSKARQEPLSKKSKRKRPKETMTTHELPAGILLAGAASASFAWTTDLGLWSTSTVTEVYALHAVLLTMLAMFLFLYAGNTAAGQAANAQRWLALAAITTGLGLANYPPFGIVAPAILIVLIGTERRTLWKQWPRNGLMILFFALGLFPYVLLPIRAAADPLLNWGNPSNWKNFWAHISAQQYQVFLSKPNLAVLSEVFPLWFRQWPLPVWFLAPFGLAGMAVSRRSELSYTLALAAANLFYVLSYDVSDVSSAPSDFALYLLPLCWCTAIWIGAGVVTLLTLLKPRVGQWGAAAYLVALFPLLAIPSNYHEAGHRGYTYADDFVRSVLEPAVPNALILTSDWTFVSPALYLQHVEGLRKDVTFLDVELLRRSWYYSYVRKRAPWLYEKAGKEIEEFLLELSKYENDQAYDPDTITNTFVAMLNALLDAGTATGHPPYVLLNLQAKDADPQGYRRLELTLGRPPYMTVGVAPGAIGSHYRWVPEMLAHRLYADNMPRPLPDVSTPPFSQAGRYDQITQAVIARYAEFWRWRGDYLEGAADCGKATVAYRRALELSPDLPEALSGLSECPGR